MSLVNQIAELIRDTSSSLPEDVVATLKKSFQSEVPDSSAAVILQTILDNVALAEKQQTPLCQDTGTLTFFVNKHLRERVTDDVIRQATALATEKGWLGRGGGG